jgi:hypothetical protein
MSNYGFFKAFDQAKLSYETTAVGDKNVYACMRKNGYSLGGEQSGHIIFGDIECTGDGIMTSLRIMEVMRAEREPLSALTRPVKLYPQLLVNVQASPTRRPRWPPSPCSRRSRRPRVPRRQRQGAREGERDRAPGARPRRGAREGALPPGGRHRDQGARALQLGIAPAIEFTFE